MAPGDSTRNSMKEERVKVSDGGRIVIPMAFREALGVKPGDEMVLRLEDGCLKACTLDQAIRQAQAVVRNYVSSDRSLSAELIRDRKREQEYE